MPYEGFILGFVVGAGVTTGMGIMILMWNDFAQNLKTIERRRLKLEIMRDVLKEIERK